MEIFWFEILYQTDFMAQLELQPAEASKTKRKVHVTLRVDMTPMVDLGFLLITFFILTTTLTEKNAMSLIVPKDGPPTDIPASKSLTLLLGAKDQVYAYEGIWNDAYRNKKILTVDYGAQQGIRSLIIVKQKELRQAGKANKLTVLIKPLDRSSYNNTVNVLDEMLINDVKTYAIVDPTEEEKHYAGE
jgi:biopolymer transport protein ExbD